MNRNTVSAMFIAAGCMIASTPLTAAHVDSEASPIYGVRIPTGYRHWELISVAHESGLNELRAVLGNAISLKAYRRGILPFPDGAILVKLAWKYRRSSEFHAAFVPGEPTTVQVMMKDSQRYATTDGWGFGRFVRGRPVDEAQHRTCFGCHQANVIAHDVVFTRYAP